VLAGRPIEGTKAFVTPKSSKGTSLAGIAANAIFGKSRTRILGPGTSPVGISTLVGGPFTGVPLRVSRTTFVARVVGRAVPVVGVLVLAYDAGSIAACTISE
jgi:hypothetical protein